MRLIGSASAHFPGPPALLWHRLLDGRSWSTWRPEVDWMLVEGDLRRGGYLTVKPRRGRQTAWHVVAVEPERELTLRLTFGPLAAEEISWRLHPDAGGTTIEQRSAVGGRFARWLVERRARRTAEQAPAGLQRLVALAELGSAT